MKTTLLTRASCIALFSLLLAFTGPGANAQIGLNFTGGSHLLAAIDEPGVVAGANWNNVIGGGGTTLSGLLDASGAVTSASVMVNSGNTYDAFTVPMTSNPATNKLYSGGLFGLGNNTADTEVSITVNNIPYAAYDVYVYSSTDTANNPTLSNTIGATTYYYGSDGTFGNSSATSLLLTTSTDPLNPTRGPAQYQLFGGLTGSSFTLTTGGSMSGIISNNVFGLHIVAAQAVPEPGSLALLIGFGIAGAGVFARRKK